MSRAKASRGSRKPAKNIAKKAPRKNREKGGASTVSQKREGSSAAWSEAQVVDQLRAIRAAARVLRALPAAAKDAALRSASKAIARREAEILAANAEDLRALPGGTDSAFRDRLLLDSKRLRHIRESLEQVADLPDPVGEVVEEKTLANGLEVRRVRSPLGVIFMIFESRPNVAVEAFSLGFKSGNAMILRGGKESRRTTAVLFEVLQAALRDQMVDGLSAALWGITESDRSLVDFLLKQKAWIDVVVPRGGDGLIEYVTRESRIPVIKNDRGLCHVYVHEDADLEMARKIVINAKTQRPGVCNSMETLLVHERVAARFLPLMYDAITASGAGCGPVDWWVCPRTLKIIGKRSRVRAAPSEAWDTEHLSLKLNCRVVSSLDEAIAHIERHGSRHSESIIAKSSTAAQRFQDEVDAAAVYWNASTRFTDGFALGLGGELGISTQKLHVRGPVGLRELTSVRWLMRGQGQVRD